MLSLRNSELKVENIYVISEKAYSNLIPSNLRNFLTGKYQKTFETDILKLRADELNFTLCMFVKV